MFTTWLRLTIYPQPHVVWDAPLRSHLGPHSVEQNLFIEHIQVSVSWNKFKWILLLDGRVLSFVLYVWLKAYKVTGLINNGSPKYTDHVCVPYVFFGGGMARELFYFRCPCSAGSECVSPLLNRGSIINMHKCFIRDYTDDTSRYYQPTLKRITRKTNAWARIMEYIKDTENIM